MKPIFIIAEIGINHNGDIGIAKKLIKESKIAGFDAVKFQKRDIDLVYDQKTLSMLMSYVGFKNIKLCNLSESDDSLLNNLENVERLPKGHLKLESFVLEGVK